MLPPTRFHGVAYAALPVLANPCAAFHPQATLQSLISEYVSETLPPAGSVVTPPPPVAALKDVPDAERGAQFICALTLLRHAEDPIPLICEGAWEGRILHAASGEHGFGYDPLFWVPERDCSSAELSPQEKNQLSHRARAMALLKARLALP